MDLHPWEWRRYRPCWPEECETTWVSLQLLKASVMKMCPFKGWVRGNALRLSRPSIDTENTTTSTCWGYECLWSQLLSFLLNLWAPPLLAIWDLGDTGTSRDYDAFVRFLGWQCECTTHTLPGAVPVARWTGAAWSDSPAKPTAQKRHILASRTCAAANMAAPTDS